jgi:hypothetical protein
MKKAEKIIYCSQCNYVIKYKSLGDVDEIPCTWKVIDGKKVCERCLTEE